MDSGALTAICLPAPQAAVAVVAAWDQGRAVCPLDPRSPLPERERVLAAVRPTALLDGDGHHDLGGGEPVPAGVAVVVATSGTTGEPKGVELTAAGLIASARAASEAVGAGPGDRWLCCLPLHSVGGLSVLARGWVTGLPVDVVDRFHPGALATTPANLVSLVPTMVWRCLDAGVALERFSRILVGGAALGPDVRARAEAAGASITATYGMTETWGGVVHDGHPLEGIEVRLGEGDDGCRRGAVGGQSPPTDGCRRGVVGGQSPPTDGCRRGVVGGGGRPPTDEIQVRGAPVMRGYRLRPTETVLALSTDGWLHTGDAGAWDADGSLRVVDRLRDLVVSGGVNVSPTEVETVLSRHPAVADVGVVGAPDPEWGEVVVAFVVPAAGCPPPALDELRALGAEHLSAAKLPRRLVAIDTIPRTPGGKPMRRLLVGRLDVRAKA